MMAILAPYQVWYRRAGDFSGPPALLFLHDALQGMLILPGEIHNLRYLGFRHFVGEYAALTHAVVMNMQHDPRRLLGSLAEESFQNMNDKFHRRKIVIQQ